MCPSWLGGSRPTTQAAAEASVPTTQIVSERGCPVATLVLGLSSPQVDRRDEHQDVHDQVDLRRQGGEHPVGA